MDTDTDTNAEIKRLRDLLADYHTPGSIWDPMDDDCGSALSCSCGVTFCAPYGAGALLTAQYAVHVTIILYGTGE